VGKGGKGGVSLLPAVKGAKNSGKNSQKSAFLVVLSGNLSSELTFEDLSAVGLLGLPA